MLLWLDEQAGLGQNAVWNDEKKEEKKKREREKRELIPSEVERRGWSMSQAYKRRMILQKYAQHEPKKLGEVPLGPHFGSQDLR